MNRTTERVDTIVVGGGQAGLSVGYFLSRQGVRFLILDAEDRIGGVWRKRWDSLRLFTPAKFDGLAGMPFPSPRHHFPTKDEMADYLATYAYRFNLPVRSGTRVERLARHGSGFVLQAGDQEFEANNVIIAMSNYQKPVTPSFAKELDPGIVQFHSIDYHGLSQLRPGEVLIVGAANSGAEIAMEVAASHGTMLSGRHPGNLPWEYNGFAGLNFFMPLLLRVVFHRILTMNTPFGRKVRPKVKGHPAPLIRVKPKRLTAAGVQRVPRVTGVRDGKPLLADGRVLDVANVIWCTGFNSGFSWIDLPIMDGTEPRHQSGVVPEVPGLYFVGLEFLHAPSSIMVHGVGRDAERIAGLVASRPRNRSTEKREYPANSERMAVGR